jgi:hypothetical protein
MSDDERIDRDAILKRRMLFIGTALVGLSACSGKTEPPPGPCLSPPPNDPPADTSATTDASTGTGSGVDGSAGGAPPQACLSPPAPKK